jgi:uncharacterized OB-fold protein
MDGQTGIVYTESIVHAAPSGLVSEAPYQIAIVEFEDGTRKTVRIDGERAAIGDRVRFAETRGGALVFTRTAHP